MLSHRGSIRCCSSPCLLPATKTMTGESSESIFPSQFVSWMRPTVGVAHTSMSFVDVSAFAPHVHFVLALSIPPDGGWYSQSAMHVPPSAVVPASPSHVGGSGKHFPAVGNVSLQPASRPPSLVPPSLSPSAGSQYSFGPQSLPLGTLCPGRHAESKRQTVPPPQH